MLLLLHTCAEYFIFIFRYVHINLLLYIKAEVLAIVFIALYFILANFFLSCIIAYIYNN